MLLCLGTKLEKMKLPKSRGKLSTCIENLSDEASVGFKLPNSFPVISVCCWAATQHLPERSGTPSDAFLTPLTPFTAFSCEKEELRPAARSL